MGADAVVRQRLVGVVDEPLVVLVADPVREQVVVVGRKAHEREDLARLWVHDDDDAALQTGLGHAPRQRLFGEALLLGVEREFDRVPGDRRRDCLEHLEPAAGSIALDGLQAVRAPEQGLVLRLDAGLADQVVLKVAPCLQFEELLRVHGSRVADDLREQRAGRVLATGFNHHLDAGQIKAGLRDEVRDPGFDVTGDPDEIEP